MNWSEYSVDQLLEKKKKLTKDLDELNLELAGRQNIGQLREKFKNKWFENTRKRLIKDKIFSSDQGRVETYLEEEYAKLSISDKWISVKSNSFCKLKSLHEFDYKCSETSPKSGFILDECYTVCNYHISETMECGVTYIYCIYEEFVKHRESKK